MSIELKGLDACLIKLRDNQSQIVRTSTNTMDNVALVFNKELKEAIREADAYD